jgi:hypothetical protein
LPVIHEVLKDLGEATIFSTLYFRSGYWQIPLTYHAKKYTAFVTPDGGQYAFKVTPFKLQGAGRTCTQLVGQEDLAGLMRKCCMHYHDDICVYAKNCTEHLQHLALVFERLRTYGLTCALEKCTFGRSRLEYLGHIITATHNEAKPEHVHAVLEVQVPRSTKDLRAFFGVCRWLREYVPDFTATALPLTALLAQRKDGGGPKLNRKLSTQSSFCSGDHLFCADQTRKAFLPVNRCSKERNGCRTLSARRRWRSEDRLLRFGEIHTRRVEIPLQRARMP